MQPQIRTIALSILLGTTLATAGCGADAEPGDSGTTPVEAGDFTK